MAPKEVTLRDVLVESVRQYSDLNALAMVDGPSVTFAELHDRATRLSVYLSQQGVGVGDRVILLGENSPHWGIAYFAITIMGAVAVPILTDFHPTDLARIVRHAEPRATFVSRRLWAKTSELLPAELGSTILLDDFTVVPQGALEADLQSDQGRSSALVSATESGDVPIPSLDADHLAVIVYTSGTTGHSKGVMLTHGNLVSDARLAVDIAEAGHKDRFLSILPLPHTYESTLGLIGPVMGGACVYYLDRPPTAAVLLPALTKIKPTVMLSVPLIIEKIYKAKILPGLTSRPLLRRLHGIPVFGKLLHRIAGKKLMATFGGKLRIFTIGGAPLAPDVELFLREARFPYAIGYGLTETSPLVAGTGPADTAYRSTGPALPGTQIRIAHPHPVNGEGEIQIKGPTVMKGYFKDPDRTRDAFTEDGWLKTGDLGVFDTDGYLYIKGRLKNMILGPSGKNIYPEEIEAIINESETVRESLVIEQGNRLVALVHLDYERLQQLFHSLGEADLRAKMNGMLAELHKKINERVPLYARIHKIVEQAEPFQKTPTQKIKRHLYVT